MSTIIRFSGGSGESEKDFTIKEEPSQVQEAFIASEGIPFRVTTKKGLEAWVNPANVAYWTAGPRESKGW